MAKQEIHAARQAVEEVQGHLPRSAAYAALDSATRHHLDDSLTRIRQALHTARGGETHDPYALDAPAARPATGRTYAARPFAEGENGNGDVATPDPSREQMRAVDRLAGAAGAVSDELDFANFVASLVHGTFDAIVDASIRQMEAFAELVSVVAKDIDSFTRENVTPNQVRDWLVDRFPADLSLELPSGAQGRPRLRVQPGGGGEEEDTFAFRSPAWLDDFGLSGEELTDELVESRLIPAARRVVAENRMRDLATMVLMGLNRVRVDSGLISARIRIRAAAADTTSVDYASSQDTTGSNQRWGRRGSNTYEQPKALVSTVGVNVQAESQLQAELFGEVRINFSSETVPLERFADAAAIQLLERHARGGRRAAPQQQPAQATSPAQQQQDSEGGET
ncbi:hypothetical protein [Ferruginivarius sediminum]|uniref:Uncharacterized protein n=1 Tax=Ferruginivarius sediminum TaxID=2661937 RepID=A0A369T6V7_9PROT|nr:hypothetical protein [Ferruginivarius sediminum]RDD61008.1 hypothetical protein DRB17_14880 [Ferruginivarius sediminum]